MKIEGIEDMRKAFVLLLAAIVLCLCACGSTAPATEATTEPTTVPTTEPIPDITVHALVPEDWSNPGCWAWKDGGEDAFAAWPGEAMARGVDWYTLQVPGWVNSVIINANDGTVQTADLAVEPGVDIWVHVVNADYAFVHYEEPAQEQLETELDQPALDYHESFYDVIYPGDYQITDTKAIAYRQGTDRYCSDYVPEWMLADAPEEVYYVIHLLNMNKVEGYYLGMGTMTGAIRQGIRVEIVELATEKVLAKSDEFMGGDPPQSIRVGESGMGSPPSEEEIRAWIDAAFVDIAKSAPAQLPYIPVNWEAQAAIEEERIASMTSTELALEKARELVETKHLSHDYLITWLTEFLSDPYSMEDAVYAADNCGADWNQNALLTAQEILAEQPAEYSGYFSYAGLVDWLVTYRYFTEDQARYAADNCGADWNEQALLQARWLTDDEDGMGYSQSTLADWLSYEPDMGGYGFTQQEASLAAQNCNADWAEEAVKAVRNILKYSDESYTKGEIVDRLVTYEGFSREDAIYGAEQNGF